MANAIYPQWKQDLISGVGLSLANPVKVAFINTSLYTYSDTHRYKSNAAAAIVGEPKELTTKTFTNGVFDADDVNWQSIVGSPAGAIIIYIDTGNVATSPLVAYLDTGIDTLPLIPDATSVRLIWNASGIFKL